jgi:hypothetical protein
MGHESGFTGAIMIAPLNDVTVKSRHPFEKRDPVFLTP